ncbi:hypothetical protein AAZV13_10G089650 [Glycine max]
MAVLTRAICAPRCTPFPPVPRSFPQRKCSSTALVAISPPMTDLVVATATATPTTTKVHGSEEVEDPTVDSTRSPGIRILRWWVMGSLHIQFLGYVCFSQLAFSRLNNIAFLFFFLF